jgi:hypothetical protein
MINALATLNTVARNLPRPSGNQCRHHTKRLAAIRQSQPLWRLFPNDFNKFSRRPATAVLLCNRTSCSLAKRQPTATMQARPAGGRNLINLVQRYVADPWPSV